MTMPLHGFGLGLRPQHYDALLTDAQGVDWLEVLSENYLVAGGRPRWMLDRMIERWPVALHGVSLNIGGSDPLDRDYLRALRGLVRHVRPAIVSDHLCWTRHGGVQFHDLLPLPQNDDTVLHVAARVRQVQDALGIPLVLENVSSYLRFAGDTLDEAQFLSAVVAESGCGLLLDVNNVFVNACNNGYDAFEFLARMPSHRVASLHVAGHFDEDDGFKIDTHGAPVKGVVWALLREAYMRVGVRPTLLERDFNFPPLAGLLAEIAQIRQAQAEARWPEVAHG